MNIIPRDPWQPLTAEMRTALKQRWPDVTRLYWAFRLALDVEVCADLLADKPVDPVRLDRKSLAESREASLVQLVRPIDILERNVA